MSAKIGDSNVNVLEVVNELLNGWCDRREYKLIYTLYGAYLAVNGQTDGWHEFLAALKQLKNMGRLGEEGITSVESEKILLLYGVVSRALNNSDSS